MLRKARWQKEGKSHVAHMKVGLLREGELAGRESSCARSGLPSGRRSGWCGGGGWTPWSQNVQATGGTGLLALEPGTEAVSVEDVVAG